MHTDHPTAKHSPLPWTAHGPDVFSGPNCIVMCDTDNATRETYAANASLIASAVNSLAGDQQADAGLIALGVEFRTAWGDERAAFNAADIASIGNSTPEIDSAHDRCARLARQMLEHRPVTLEGVKTIAMVWGWLHYLSSKPDEYEGAEAGNSADERTCHAVMSFLLKDVAA